MQYTEPRILCKSCRNLRGADEDIMRAFICIQCLHNWNEQLPNNGPSNSAPSEISHEEMEYITAHLLEMAPTCSNTTMEKWLKQRMTPSRNAVSGYVYLVTFTRNPNSRFTKTQWRLRVRLELHKGYLSSGICVEEHPDTNIHVHARIQTNRAISKNQHFRTFERDYGSIDLKRVKVDNGVANYFTKERKSVNIINY